MGRPWRWTNIHKRNYIIKERQTEIEINKIILRWETMWDLPDFVVVTMDLANISVTSIIFWSRAKVIRVFTPVWGVNFWGELKLH